MCGTAIVCLWGMLISFAIVDSNGCKTHSVRLVNPLAPLAGFQAPLTGRLWVPADTTREGPGLGIPIAVRKPGCEG